MKTLKWSCKNCNKQGVIKINKPSAQYVPFNSYRIGSEAYTEHNKLSPECSGQLLTFIFEIFVSPEVQKALFGPLTSEQEALLKILLSNTAD